MNVKIEPEAGESPGAAVVMVHGLEMACAALRAGRAGGRAICLVSGPGAASYAGVGWWRALVAAADRAVPGVLAGDVLDCGAAPGRALEALHAGQKRLVLHTTGAIFDDIAALAEACGAVLLGCAPAAFDMGAREGLEGWVGKA